MHFGLYLTEKGILSSEQFIEVLKCQLTSRPLLGAIAIETGKLSTKQVFYILRAQTEAHDQLFGELAVELGFLTDEDVADLILRQSMRVRPMQQLISELGFVSPEELHGYLPGFHSQDRPLERKELAAAF